MHLCSSHCTSMNITAFQNCVITSYKKMSLFSAINPLIRICQSFGLVSYSMNRTTLKWESKIALNILSIFIIICNAFIFLGALTFNDTFLNHYKSSRIRFILFSILLYWSHIFVLITLLERFSKRNQQIKLLNRFEHLDFSFKQHLNMTMDYVKLKIECRRFIIAWMCEVFALLIVETYQCIKLKSFQHFKFYVIFFPSYLLCKLSYAYTMVLVTLIRENIYVLNKYLKSITKPNGYYLCDTFSNRKQFQRKKNFNSKKICMGPETILFMKNTYSKIWEASIDVTHLTYWTLPIGLSYDIFVLIFNCWGFATLIFQNSNNVSAYLFLIALISSDLCNMIFIAHSCSKTTENVSNRN